MTNCTMNKDIIILAANRDLKVPKRIRIYIHLRKCEECRKIYQEYRILSGLLGELPEHQVSDSLIKSIENRTGVKQSEPSVLDDLLSIFLFSRVKLAGAAVVILAVISVLLFRTNIGELDGTKADYYYSSADINSANVKTKEALALLGKFLDKTQVQIESEILGKKVSRPLNKGIKTATEIFNTGDKNESN